MNYRSMFLKRYKLSETPFVDGFLYVLGLGRSPFADAFEAIKNSTPEEALQQDFEAIAGDFNRVFRQEVMLLDGEEK